jgi:hypothetical protein
MYCNVFRYASLVSVLVDSERSIDLKRLSRKTRACILAFLIDRSLSIDLNYSESNFYSARICLRRNLKFHMVIDRSIKNTWRDPKNDLDYLKAFLGKDWIEELRSLKRGQFLYQYRNEIHKIQTEFCSRAEPTIQFNFAFAFSK